MEGFDMTKELSDTIRLKLRWFLMKDESNSDLFLLDLNYYLKPYSGEIYVDDIKTYTDDNVYRVTIDTNHYISSLILNTVIMNTVNLFIVENIQELDLCDTLKACDMTTNKKLYKVFELESNSENGFSFII